MSDHDGVEQVITMPWRAQKVLAHEMGHNFGLYHAHSLDCGSDPIGPSCSWSEYGDTIDMMGLESAGHFAAFAKERLGWLNYSSSPPLTTVTTSGTYRIEPYSAYGTGSKGLKVLQSVSSTGQRTWYYVEYRSASGFDSFLGGNTNITGGVVIRTGAESSADSSYLLDMTPETDSWYDPALVVGRSFTDPAAGITITPTSIDSTGAAVYVQVGAVTCTRSAPAVAISPSPTVWASPGSQVQFSVTVTNQDASGCPASTFALSDVIPPGWVASFAAADLTTTPGSAASTSMSVGVPSGTAGGMYTITASANAADAPSLAASASVTCALPSDTNATLQVSSDKPSYSKNQSVTVSGVLTVNSVAVQGTSVTFTVTRPDGSKLTGSGVTDASGRGAWTFRLKGNPPRGTYNVVASASVGGVATSGTAAFIVQ